MHEAMDKSPIALETVHANHLEMAKVCFHACGVPVYCLAGCVRAQSCWRECSCCHARVRRMHQHAADVNDARRNRPKRLRLS